MCIRDSGNRLFDRRSALYGALILVTSFEYFYLGKAAVTDITLSCFFSGVIFAYLSRQYRLMYAFMGLSVLTKGPVGIVLPLAIILLHLIATKNWLEIFNLKIFQGGIIFLLITVPWYGMMYNLHGMDFIETFLGFHNVTRFLSPEHESGQIWYYYLPVLCLSLIHISLGGVFVGQTLTTVFPFPPLQIPIGICTTYAIGKVAHEWIKDVYKRQEGSETRVSMAWVIIGGLVSSTIFTLLVIPIIFLFFEKIQLGIRINQWYKKIFS